MSALPIDASTLKYGSANGGRTFSADEHILNKVNQIGKQLNLRPHVPPGYPDVQTAGPVDLEGHRTKKGQTYLVDFERMMPPQAVDG